MHIHVVYTYSQFTDYSFDPLIIIIDHSVYNNYSCAGAQCVRVYSSVQWRWIKSILD